MVLVEYLHRYPYRDYAGRLFPFFVVTLRNPDNGLEVEQDAFLDSGASRSLFRGEVAGMLGLELLAGEPLEFSTNTGQVVTARIHTVQIALPESEDQPGPQPFNLSLAFSLSDLGRNLFGRDFFDLVQIGFREHESEFFLSPDP
jgi:hypothetical protein